MTDRWSVRHQQPKPRWFALLERLFPDRCREVPEPQDSSRIIMRQFAIVRTVAYLQQFCGSEDPRFLHSHQFRRSFAIGLRGAYYEFRLAGPPRLRKAPYFYTMDASVIHQVRYPTADHLSVFVGIGRDDDLKRYFGTPTETGSEEYSLFAMWAPLTLYRKAERHIRTYHETRRI